MCKDKTNMPNSKTIIVFSLTLLKNSKKIIASTNLFSIFANVIDFERHITKLLLSNDCVIVPGFGGFMAHHMEARYDAESHLFYPPHRTLGFNPQLTMNDSLLVQSFIEVYDISYPEALTRIEEDVNELKHILDTEGEYEMSGLGTLVLNHEGKYEFTPCEAGILTPNLYGLSTFEMAKATTEAKVTPSTKVVSLPVCDTPTEVAANDAGKIVSLEEASKRTAPLWLLRDIAAVCIILIAVILMPKPANNKATNLANAEVNTTLLTKIMPKDITTGEPQSLEVCPKTADTEDQLVATHKAKEATTPTYTVVLASRVSKVGAEQWVKKLHAEGLTEAEVLVGFGYTKVVYGKYVSYTDAHQMLQRLNKNEELSNSWIINLTAAN